MSTADEPATPRGRETYNNLLQSAEEIFEKEGFFRTSVAAICRHAQVANGTFYRYFSDKNDIFMNLARRLSDQLTEKIQSSFQRQTQSFPERLKIAFRGYFSFLHENSSIYQIFRQAEFVDKELHQAFYSNLTETIASGLEEGVEGGYFRDHDSSVAASCLLGVLSFVSMKWVIWESSTVGESIVDDLLELLLEGINNSDSSLNVENIPDPPPVGSELYPERETLQSGADKTESRLLRAAEQCFGGSGFYGTTVSDITRQAEVAQGTFYHYFSSKVEAFERLVKEINRLWRWEVRRGIQDLDDRRAVEYQGFRIFFSFIANHPRLYRIVREAEFVDQPSGQWYYQRFAEGYQGGLSSGMERGEVRTLDPEVLAYSLMGIGHFLGQKWFVREYRSQAPPAEFDEMFDLILHGVGVKAPTR